MAGNRRSNKATRVRPRHENEDWFEGNRKRQRRRNKIAKASRRKNRGK